MWEVGNTRSNTGYLRISDDITLEARAKGTLQEHDIPGKHAQCMLNACVSLGKLWWQGFATSW